MTPRLDAFAIAPAPVRAMIAVQTALALPSIEPGLMELIKLRASQINGCAYCLHMHVTDAVKMGESHMRIHLLPAWREAPVFTDRERAVLAWTEALTLIADTHAPDADYEAMRTQFNDAEIVHLTLAIGAINLWNRLQIGLRAIPPVEPVSAAG